MNEERNNRILVCIDFHEQSLVALQQCYDIARFINARIDLLYVIETNDFFAGLLSSNLDTVKAEVNARLNQIAENASKESGLVINYSFETGKTYEQILHKAKEINARFIVMGKNGSNKGLTKYLGSNSIRVISQSLCPVISVKGGKTIEYKTIVLPIDLTKETREKVASAISFGKHFGSHVYVVSVLTGGILMPISRIYRKMKRVQNELELNGVKCSLKLFKKSKEDNWQQVLKYSYEINADLIMLMTRREGRISDYYIGAFANHIINESEIPVLTIIPSYSFNKSKTVVETIVDPFNIF